MPNRKSRSAERLVLGAIIIFIVAAYALTKPTEDFVEYWASAKLLNAGQNPYSLTGVLQIESPLGWNKAIPLMNLSPPWALPLLLPLRFISSYSLAWFIAEAVLSALLACSVRILLDIYSSGRPVFPQESRWGETVLAFTFYPALLSLKLSQVTTIVLLGFAGFLYFERRKQYGLAGAFLVLASIKPQLGYLIWIALLLNCLRPAEWKVLLSLGSGIGLFSLIALHMRPSAFADYLSLSQSGYLKAWPSALGGLMRIPFGTSEGSFPLQFVPPVAGAIWLLFYWYRHRARWCWSERMPMLITVSLLTTAYGWMFDQVLLLIPIVFLVSTLVSAKGKIPPTAKRLYTLTNVLTIAAASFASGLGFVVAPLLILYALNS